MMRMPGPMVALRSMVQLARSKRRRNRSSSLATNEEAPEVAESSRANSEIRVLDDSFVEQQQEEAGADRPTTLDRKRVKLHFDGGRRVFAVRRHQFTQWKGQAASSAARTLRGCYTLAQQELTAWRNRSKVASAATDTPSSDTSHRDSSSLNLKRSRSSSHTSAISSSSIASSLSSATDLEEERRKELNRSDFSLDERQTRALKMKPSQRGFTEMTCGSHERLLLVNALPLNDSDDEDNSSTTRHLPYRKTMIHGRVYLLKNQWV